MNCPPEEQLLQAELEELSVAALRSLEQHEQGCEKCRRARAEIRTLLLDLGAPEPGGQPREAFIADVVERCIREPQSAPVRARGTRWAWTAALAVAALVALAWLRPGWLQREPERWAARGTPSSEPKVYAKVLVVHGDTFRPVQGATLGPGDGFSVRYWNTSLRTYYLMAFALDAKGTMHWIFPAYLDAASDPQSIPIAPNAQGRLLGEVVEPESPAEGPLQVTVLLTERPLSVQMLERRAAAGKNGSFDDLAPLRAQTWSSTWQTH